SVPHLLLEQCSTQGRLPTDVPLLQVDLIFAHDAITSDIAVVEVEDDDGNVACYRIVGEDEIDLKQGHISWQSPLGRALLKKQVGDAVIWQRPAGQAEVTVLSVKYG